MTEVLFFKDARDAVLPVEKFCCGFLKACALLTADIARVPAVRTVILHLEIICGVTAVKEEPGPPFGDLSQGLVIRREIGAGICDPAFCG